MDQQMLDVIPEHLRSFYENKVINPNSLATKFKTLSKAEEVKEKIRLTSNLYKVFGENLFSFTTINGELNLDIRVLYPIEFLKDIRDECNLTMIRMKTVSEATEVFEEKQYPPTTVSVNGDDRVISFDQVNWIERVQSEYKDLDEAYHHVLEITKDAIVDNGQKSLYLNKKTREDIEAINRMLRSIQSSSTLVHNLLYFRQTIKATELQKSIKNINWRYELRIL